MIELQQNSQAAEMLAWCDQIASKVTPTLESGVYTIFSKTEKKGYIGVSENIRQRWKTHLAALRNGTHPCVNLQRVFDSYGKDDLLFRILERTSKSIERENWWKKKNKGRLLNNIGDQAIPKRWDGTKLVRLTMEEWLKRPLSVSSWVI